MPYYLVYLFQYLIILFIFAAGMAVYNSILLIYLTKFYQNSKATVYRLDFIVYMHYYDI